ncbi:MAG TPA: OmpA family protein [Spirochaetia bacterium]|nr:OmpA family protein [Spirochaetia bacterium]
MQKLAVCASGFLLFAVLLGCQTTPTQAPRSAILLQSGGAERDGTQGPSVVELGLSFGGADLVKSWKVDIANAEGSVRSWTGDGKRLPTTLSWDGKSDAGAPAPEGSYVARLSIDYQKTYEAAFAESAGFALDITPQGDMAPFDASRLAPGVYPSWPASSAAKTAGFSPRSDTLARTEKIALSFGQASAVTDWKLTIAQPGQAAVRTFQGDGTRLPAAVIWDGRSDDGTAAPDGTYTAQLSVVYGSASQPVQVTSKPFVLDVTPPSGAVVADPPALTANEGGEIQAESFSLSASSKVASIQSWTLSVIGPDNKPVASFSGLEPDAHVPWDGKLANGASVDPAQTYSVLAQVQDAYGNVGVIQGSLNRIAVASVESAPPVRDPAGGKQPASPKQPEIASPAATEEPSAIPELAGFSPQSDTLARMQTIALSYGQASLVTAWNLAIAQSGRAAARSFQGDGTKLPASVVWDGLCDDGTPAPEGTYTAQLSVSYRDASRPALATSQPFVLDVTPPKGSISLSAPLFSPREGADTLTLSLAARSSTARIDSWSMDIYDPDGNLFNSLHGQWPTSQAVWDGKGLGGARIESAESYPVVARIRDEFGNVGEAKIIVPVDILVEKTAAGNCILTSNIYFKDFTADCQHVAPDLAKQNVARLDALAKKLKKFPDYKIRIVGHAVAIYWFNPALAKREQRDVLIPLSKARAEAIKRALVARGINGAKLSTEGVGASDQSVSDRNLADRWQNRQVDLYVEK